MHAELTQLAELAHALQARMTLEDLLQHIAATAARLTRTPHASLRLLDPTGSRLLAVARAGEPLHLDAAFEFERGEGLLGWIAEHGAEPAATAMVTIQPWLPHPRYPSGTRPYFHSVSTLPAHRGRGLAQRLTEAAVEWARNRGFVTFALHASEQGRPIYERLGFVGASEYVLPLR